MKAREVGHLTVTTFNKFYKHYKNTWDIEMRLFKSNTTYAELYVKSQKEEEWF